MASARCLNCDGVLDGQARFCPTCGQRTDTGRLLFGDVWRDLMHSFVNIERSPFAFAGALILRPGVVAREFVEGKRRRYYGPFATLAVMVSLTALVINVSGFRVMGSDGLGASAEDLLQRHFNFVILAQLPLLGVCGRLVFWQARLNLFEHMVLVGYALSIRVTLTTLSILLAYAAAVGSPPAGAALLHWIAWYLYFGWAASQFYPSFQAVTRPVAWLLGMAAAGLAHGAIMAIFFGADAVYRHFASPIP